MALSSEINKLFSVHYPALVIIYNIIIFYWPLNLYNKYMRILTNAFTHSFDCPGLKLIVSIVGVDHDETMATDEKK